MNHRIPVNPSISASRSAYVIIYMIGQKCQVKSVEIIIFSLSNEFCWAGKKSALSDFLYALMFSILFQIFRMDVFNYIRLRLDA